MQKILLLEPSYRNKFPPIGLMKLASYHKSKGDFVLFSKGKLENNSAEIEWDRVYVTTLFTFEWKRSIELVEYAVQLAGDRSKVFVGGIAASLMPDEFEKETGIKPMCGLLRDSAQIGYDDGVDIDMLIPDYSILEHIKYRYPFADGYFLTATRGCGMKCSFCAVQKLEPEYIDYIPILPRIEEIKRLYGEKKNLYLMDNNILKSRAFPRIIEDIKKAGFYKGAKIINQRTGKPNLRHMDFNQGLDMNFINEDRARLLSQIAISPFHLAYDHIDDTEKYVQSLELLDKHDLTDVCAYLLYNTPDFSGKGKPRRADTPEDLYNRVRTNVEFAEKVNSRRAQNGCRRFDAFSFPMKYIPLNAKDRSYIGENWNRKLLDGVNEMCGIMHGGFIASRKGFQEILGRSYSEFYRNLLMPKAYIKNRVSPNTRLDDGDPRLFWIKAREQWILQYNALNETERKEFGRLIADGVITAEKISSFVSEKTRALYYHYFTGYKMVELYEFSAKNPAILKELKVLNKSCPEIAKANYSKILNRKDGEKLAEYLSALLG